MRYSKSRTGCSLWRECRNMPTTRDELLKSALELPEADRLQLATELMQSLGHESLGWFLDDPEFLRELEARAQDGSPGVPWERVQAELRADLGM